MCGDLITGRLYQFVVDHRHPWFFGSLDSKLFNHCVKHRLAFAAGACAGRMIEYVSLDGYDLQFYIVLFLILVFIVCRLSMSESVKWVSFLMRALKYTFIYGINQCP